MRSRTALLGALTLIALAGPSALRAAAGLSDIDRVRLAEAFRLSDSLSDRLWPGLGRVPFAVLLVTSDQEYLVRHPAPTPDFARVGHDDLLGSDVFARQRHFPINFQATFAAVGDIPTVVMGVAENTQARTSTPWIVTLLHEHFHQMQYSRPSYGARVAALGLAHGDSSGMWMLNFPFPYDSADVIRRFDTCSVALSRALRARGSTAFPDRAREFRAAREELFSALPGEPGRYFELQCWQEGVARYMELKAARMAARGYIASPAFRALPDAVPFDTVADRLERVIFENLDRPHLAGYRRVVFYSFGAAEGLLLDAIRPDWTSRYFERACTLAEDFKP